MGYFDEQQRIVDYVTHDGMRQLELYVIIVYI